MRGGEPTRPMAAGRHRCCNLSCIPYPRFGQGLPFANEHSGEIITRRNIVVPPRTAWDQGRAKAPHAPAFCQGIPYQPVECAPPYRARRASRVKSNQQGGIKRNSDLEQVRGVLSRNPAESFFTLEVQRCNRHFCRLRRSSRRV
jgi:hypothetical protein